MAQERGAFEIYDAKREEKNPFILRLKEADGQLYEDMKMMFFYCESLTSLDLSSFDTSKVENMGWMFSYCESLTALDLSNFDTSKVTDMNEMFRLCESLTSLDLSNRNILNIKVSEPPCSHLVSCANVTVTI